MATRKTADSISHRRRAIHLGLKQYLQGDDLMNALCIWQQHYARLPKFAITNFVRRITEETNLEASRAAIHLSLTSSLMLAEDKLGPDPLAEMRAFLGKRLGHSDAEAILGGADTTTTMSAQTSQSDSMRVFEILMSNFLAAIADSHKTAAADIRAAFVRQLDELLLDVDQRQALQQWFMDSKRPLQINLSAEQLQQLLHHCYVIVCDRLGPVRTDQCLSEALTIAERSESGRRASPRDWL